jgi:hypothetical protein
MEEGKVNTEIHLFVLDSLLFHNSPLTSAASSLRDDFFLWLCWLRLLFRLGLFWLFWLFWFFWFF